ncbi:MAG: hypothetical protein WKG01_32955 [Kofleriaceae bacterium]
MKANLAFLLIGLVGCAADPGPTGDDDGGDDAPPFTNGVSTLAGAGEPGFVDGPRGTSRFANPVNVAYAPDGMLYVADFDNNKVRVVDPDDGTTTTLVDQAGFKRPFAFAFDDGIMYVSTDDDPAGGHNLMSGTIWRVDTGTGEATVIAENIGRPRGMAVLPDGRIAFSDYMHHVVQLLDPATGLVTPLAGTWDVKGMVDGVGGKFSTPYGIATINGELLVADFDNNRVRVVTLDGTVSTYAGAGTAGFQDGSMSAAQFDRPQGMVATSAGVFVTDLGNYRIRKLSGDGVMTVAGSGAGGYLDSDDKLAAQFYGLEGMSATPDGSMLFVADGGRGENVPYNRVRSIKIN